MIYLVAVENDGKEVHMEWEGHTSLLEAQKEFEDMRSLSVVSGIKPMDGFVYEADKPEYGNKAVKLDVNAFSKHALNWAESQVK
jgi:hypothetical protein